MRDFVDDIHEMFRVFESENNGHAARDGQILLFPCILNSDAVVRGYNVLSGAGYQAYVRNFLLPFIDICHQHQSSLFAIDVMNEPEYAITAGARERGLRIDQVSVEVYSFLRQVVAEIRSAAANIDVSIGYAHLETMLDGAIGSEALGCTYHQYHLYGGNLITAPVLNRNPRRRTDNYRNICIGEIGSHFEPQSLPQPGPGNPWDDRWTVSVAGAAYSLSNMRMELESRLKMAKEHAYDTVLLWSGARDTMKPRIENGAPVIDPVTQRPLCEVSWRDAFYGGLSPGDLGGGTLLQREDPVTKEMTGGVNPAVRRAVYAALTPTERVALGVVVPDASEPGRGP